MGICAFVDKQVCSAEFFAYLCLCCFEFSAGQSEGTILHSTDGDSPVGSGPGTLLGQLWVALHCPFGCAPESAPLWGHGVEW